MPERTSAMPQFLSVDGYRPHDEPVDLRNTDVLVTAFRDPEHYTPVQMAAARTAACLLARRDWPYTSTELAELVFPDKTSKATRARELDAALHGEDGLFTDVRAILRKEGCDVRKGRYLPTNGRQWETVYGVERVGSEAGRRVISLDAGVLEWEFQPAFPEKSLPSYAPLAYQAAALLTANHAQIL